MMDDDDDDDDGDGDDNECDDDDVVFSTFASPHDPCRCSNCPRTCTQQNYDAQCGGEQFPNRAISKSIATTRECAHAIYLITHFQGTHKQLYTD